jgi:hypothetical protein
VGFGLFMLAIGLVLTPIVAWGRARARRRRDQVDDHMADFVRRQEGRCYLAYAHSHRGSVERLLARLAGIVEPLRIDEPNAPHPRLTGAVDDRDLLRHAAVHGAQGQAFPKIVAFRGGRIVQASLRSQVEAARRGHLTEDALVAHVHSLVSTFGTPPLDVIDAEVV